MWLVFYFCCTFELLDILELWHVVFVERFLKFHGPRGEVSQLSLPAQNATTDPWSRTRNGPNIQVNWGRANAGAACRHG